MFHGVFKGKQYFDYGSTGRHLLTLTCAFSRAAHSSSSRNSSKGSRFILREPEKSTGSCSDSSLPEYPFFYLGDDGNGPSQLVQSHMRNVHFIYQNPARPPLDESEEGDGQRALAWQKTLKGRGIEPAPVLPTIPILSPGRMEMSMSWRTGSASER